jgi:hypothetical protein
MIPLVPGWSTEALPHGVFMTHPEGKAVATIAYRERARPLLRLGAMVRSILARTPGWAATKVASHERLETIEGEHAALVTLAGTQDGVPAQRDLGFTFGDDFVSSVGGLCFREAAFRDQTTLVRELTRYDSHVLGIRRRRFEYDPPAGWQPVSLPGQAVDWLAPEYPRQRVSLTVHAASPHALVDNTSLDAVQDFMVNSTFFGSIGETATGVGGAVSDAVGGPEWLGQGLGAVAGGVAGLGQGLWNTGAAVVGGVATIGSAIGSGISAIADW